MLTLNRLRHRVRLRTDGGIKTGRDVVIAAILGAEEFGLGTASLVAMGCILVRQCHSNTCPVGVCTQDDEAAREVQGTPEKVVNSDQLRRRGGARDPGLARRALAQRGDRPHRSAGAGQPRRRHLDDLDLNPILAQADPGDYPRYCTLEGRNEVPDTLDAQMIKDAKAAVRGRREDAAHLQHPQHPPRHRHAAVVDDHPALRHDRAAAAATSPCGCAARPASRSAPSRCRG